MSKTIALITIHGMGDTDRNYSSSFHDKIKRSVGVTVWNKVIFKQLYYQDILQDNETVIFERMRPHIDWMKLRKFLLFGFSDAAGLEYKKYVKDSPYFLTQKRIVELMDEIFNESGSRNIPVIILAQSLGGQVISNYIWDADPKHTVEDGVWSTSQQGQDGVVKGSPKDNFRRMRTLQCLYTTGCNIPIFVSGHKNIESINPPIETFKWFNFYDEDDVLGWPLKPLSASYDALVEDIPINANGNVFGAITRSWNPFSHEQYWTDSQVIDHIASTINLFS